MVAQRPRRELSRFLSLKIRGPAIFYVVQERGATGFKAQNREKARRDSGKFGPGPLRRKKKSQAYLSSASRSFWEDSSGNEESN